MGRQTLYEHTCLKVLLAAPASRHLEHMELDVLINWVVLDLLEKCHFVEVCRGGAEFLIMVICQENNFPILFQIKAHKDILSFQGLDKDIVKGCHEEIIVWSLYLKLSQSTLTPGFPDEIPIDFIVKASRV